MVWVVKHPLLICLPLFISFFLFIFISASFVLGTKAGGLRFFVYQLSAVLMVFFFLTIDSQIRLATTHIEIKEPGNFIRLKDINKITYIPFNKIQGAIVEGDEKEPDRVEVISEEACFFLDGRFSEFSAFFPLLRERVDLKMSFRTQEKTYFLPPGNNIPVKPEQKSILYLYSWLILTAFFVYPLGKKAWTGHYPAFFWIIFYYGLPLLIFSIWIRISLTMTIFLLFYPLYLLFLSALCIPENQRP